MKLSVHVMGRDVAVLEQSGDFRSVLSYHAHAAADDFVSLTMPVRTQSYVWDDQLPPVLQMNLPEGYLLQVLQEQFGPHVGASPIALLSVIGRNMVGRVQVAAPGASLDEPARPIEVAELLKGDNSEDAFAELVRQHATSGVSGVVPKFLDAGQDGDVTPLPLAVHKKASLVTRRHIIKGSSRQLPFVALNEHLCMQVAARVMPTARTEVSEDGQALVVHRFDVDEHGQPHWGMEDFCALLGLRPAAKYGTTWERIAKAVRDHVPGSRRLDTFRQLATTLMLTYALRNADCHAKNLALLYTCRADAHLSPAYDLLTTSVYAGFQHNPPGIEFMGKKTWTPGRNLQKFIAASFGVPPREQARLVEAISDAVADVAPQVRDAMARHPGFNDSGKRMLMAWSEGVQGLRDQQDRPLAAAGQALISCVSTVAMPIARSRRALCHNPAMQFTDLKAQYTALKPQIDAGIQAVLDHGLYIMGPEVKALEAKLAARTGVKHCVTVASGTEALLIALMALGIKAGDEVITSPFTFAATGEVIALLGAKPVFVDIEPDTCNLDASLLEAAITPRTRAIMPVSLYGQVADMDRINAIAARHGLPVIEDAAQSYGATFQGKPSGGLSTIGCTSFFPSKPLGCYGDGGALFTDDDALAQAAREIRVHGQSARYTHTRIGVGGRMDTLQCAVVLAKLERFDWELARRREIGARYHRLLAPLMTLANERGLGLITVRPDRDSVWGQYTVFVPQRDKVQAALQAAGVPTAVHYPKPLHHQAAYAEFCCPDCCPNSIAAAARVMSLPMSADLSEADQDRVVAALAAALDALARDGAAPAAP